MLSHIGIASIGLIMLIAVILAATPFRISVESLVSKKLPNVQNGLIAMVGIQKSLASLRGWVTIGENNFKITRKKAWEEDIWPTIDHLNKNIKNEQSKRVHELQKVLTELEYSQWWVEDVAGSTGNESARLILSRDLEPNTIAIQSIISALIDIEKTLQTGSGRKTLLGWMADFRFLFTRSEALIINFVDSGGSPLLESFNERLIGATIAFENIDKYSDGLNDDQQEYFLLLKEEFSAYKNIAGEIVSLRKSESWNVAHHLMKSETVPLAENAIKKLKELSENYASEMKAEILKINKTGKKVMIMIISSVILMIITAAVISNRSSDKIMRPIVLLTNAANDFAKKRTIREVKVDTNDEIGILTETFNDMTHSLKNNEDSLKRRTMELETSNKELEDFSYAVSHNLHTPLRGIDGISRAILEDYEGKLDERGVENLKLLCENSKNMNDLIEALQKLSRVTRKEVTIEIVDLSELAKDITKKLKAVEPDRNIDIIIEDGLVVKGDGEMLSIVLQKLLDNAWKFTDKRPDAKVEFGSRQEEGQVVFFVKDNGVGFNMEYSNMLFNAFQRLHSVGEYKGTGIGLATVKRIITRHGGKVWGEGKEDKGATFYFNL